MGGILISLSVLVSLLLTVMTTQIGAPIRQALLPDSGTRATLEAENVVERAKAELIAVMRQFAISSVQLRDGLEQALPVPRGTASPTAPQWAVALTTEHVPLGGPKNVKVAITGVSPQTSETHHVDVQIRITASQNGKPVDRLRAARLRLGQSGAFTNAATGNSFSCVFCHAHIYGDVGEYYDHGLYFNSPRENEVHGTWNTAGKDLPYNDGASATVIPAYTGYVRKLVTGPSLFLPTQDESVTPHVGGWFTSGSGSSPFGLVLRGFSSHYSGPKLPYNFRRQKRMLPKLDPETMLILAQGTLGGGTISSTPYGGQGLTAGPAAIDKIFEGNVLLDGRTTPLQINGRVFVRGDVVILGQVKGQGAIYSGRNIYIPDDLTYANPPALFDGTQASNDLLDGVSTNAAALAAAAAANDQLVLFATNNIIIGDPYPETASASAVSPAQSLALSGNVYIHKANATTYNGLLAVDSVKGYMLDGEVLSSSAISYLLPWERAGKYVDAARVTAEPVLLYNWNCGLAPDDKSCVLDSSGWVVPKYFQDLFYPKNMVNGVAKDWITQADFLTNTANATVQAQQSAATGALRAAFHYFSLPLLLKFPFDSTKWNTGWEAESSTGTEGVVASVENMTGLFSQTAGLPVYTSTAGATTTLDAAFKRFADLMKQAVQGTGASSPAAGYPIWGYFDYNSKAPIGSLQGRAAITITFNWLTYMCSDVGAGILPWYKTYDGNAVPLCSLSGPLDSSASDPRPTYNGMRGLFQGVADVEVHASWYATVGGSTSSLELNTRYWDPAKVRVRNRVKRVDAFLFANQFVVAPRDSINDNPLQLNGGILATDVFGRFANSNGPMAPATTQYVMANAGTDPPGYTPQVNAGPVPYFPGFFFAAERSSLTIRLDPRVQFGHDTFYSIDLIQSDLGSTDLFGN